jgi:hypothetical protein
VRAADGAQAIRRVKFGCRIVEHETCRTPPGLARAASMVASWRVMRKIAAA